MTSPAPPASGRALAAASFADGLRLAPAAFRELWPSLLALHAIELGASQSLGALQERVLARGTEDLFAIGMLIGWQAAISSLWTCAYVCIVGIGLMDVADGRPPRSWRARLIHAWNQTLIETVRVWASVLRWSLFLIVPAAAAFARLFWTPMVAAMDSVYDRGEVDALERSRALSRGRFGLSFGFALASLALPALSSLIVQGNEDRLTANPAGVIVGSAVAAAIGYALFVWATCAFRRLISPERSLQDAA